MEMGKVSIAILLFITSLVVASNAATNSTAEEEVEGSADATTRSESTLTPAQLEHRKNVYASFKKVLIHSLNIADTFIPGAALVEQFLGLIDALSGRGNDDIWSQIESKVKFSIADAQTKRHFKNFKTKWVQFSALMKLGDAFDRSDLITIVSKKSDFFPQDHDDLLYSTKFITSMQAFLVYLTGGYLDLITRNKIKKCSLASELASVRRDIIQAAKDLHKKRYQSLHGTGYTTKRGPISNLQRALKYTDKAVDANTETTVLGTRVLSDVFGVTTTNTTDTIMPLVNAYNAYLIEDICQAGCTIPAEITRAQVNFALPKVCWEVNKSHSGTCLLPCDLYGETSASSAWCPTNLTTGKWGTLFQTTGYQYCNRRDMAGWNECMRTTTTENNMPFLSKKERKKLKKKERKV